MPALTAPLQTSDQLYKEAAIGLWKLPMAANATIYAGSLVMIDGGYAKPGAVATGKLAAGRAEETVSNAGGAAGAKVIEVRRGSFKWKNSASADAITAADHGTVCYIVDDQTVAKTDGGGTRSKAGRVMQVETDGVFVETGLFNV